MPRLNNEERARLLGMPESGLSQSHVARLLKVPRSMNVRLEQRVNTTGRVSDTSRSGAPRVTSVPQDSFIRQRHLRNSVVTVQSTTSVVIRNRGRTVCHSQYRAVFFSADFICILSVPGLPYR